MADQNHGSWHEKVNELLRLGFQVAVTWMVTDAGATAFGTAAKGKDVLLKANGVTPEFVVQQLLSKARELP